MDKETWKGLILSALGDMADEQFQRRAWAGIGPESSSLVEIICRLFDDVLLREYVKKYASTLPSKTLSDVRDLDERVQRLNAEYLDTLPALDAINSPEWVEISDLANDLKLAFERD